MTSLSLVTSHRLGAGFALAALLCLGTPFAFADTPKDTLVIADQLDSSISMDPAESFEGVAPEVIGNVYDRLVRFDPNHPDQPMMDVATSYQLAPDGKTYTFTLRPGLKFATGNPLTAEEAAWSLQRAIILDKSPAFILSQFGFTAANVKDRIKATGPTTLVLVTDEAYAPSFVLNCLTANVGAIVDKNLLMAHDQGGDMGNNWLKTNSAGSGPFKLREWRANEVMLMERNDNYYGKKPPMARVIYRHVKESATQRLLLTKGDIDVADNLNPQDLDALARDKMVKIVPNPSGEIFYFSLNQKNPILAKPEVREAFKWLVDYSAIEATIMKNAGIVNQNFLPQGLLGWVKDAPYKLDVAKAKALLAKAGYPNGFKVTMDVRSTEPFLGLAEAIQASAKRAGIEIEILSADGKQVLTRYRARKHDLLIYNWQCDYWDPHTNADTFARNPDNSDDGKVKSLAWRNAWNIPEMTKQCDAAVLERDTKKRAKMYHDIQAEFRKTSPFVPMIQQIFVAAVRGNVQDYKIGANAGTTALNIVSKK